MTETTEVDNGLTRNEQLRQIRAQRKAMREQEKALRAELDETKEARKAARKAVAETKQDAMEARSELTSSIRELNNLMLTKSLRNNADAFRQALETFHERASAVLTAGNAHLEAIEALQEAE